jgi:dTDP-glucose pyrophosphorylase
MQCVLLAAGRGVRLGTLTKKRPKPLVKVHGKPLIDWIAQALPSNVHELIIVVGYRSSQLVRHCGANFFGRKVLYVHQPSPQGTGDALMRCRRYLEPGSFLVMSADDIHGGLGLTRLVEHELGVLAAYHEEPQKFGVISMSDSRTLLHIIEKPEHSDSHLVSTGALVLDERIFSYPAVTSKNVRAVSNCHGGAPCARSSRLM